MGKYRWMMLFFDFSCFPGEFRPFEGGGCKVVWVRFGTWTEAKLLDGSPSQTLRNLGPSAAERHSPPVLFPPKTICELVFSPRQVSSCQTKPPSAGWASFPDLKNPKQPRWKWFLYFSWTIFLIMMTWYLPGWVNNIIIHHQNTIHTLFHHHSSFHTHLYIIKTLLGHYSSP